MDKPVRCSARLAKLRRTSTAAKKRVRTSAIPTRRSNRFVNKTRPIYKEEDHSSSDEENSLEPTGVPCLAIPISKEQKKEVRNAKKSIKNGEDVMVPMYPDLISALTVSTDSTRQGLMSCIVHYFGESKEIRHVEKPDWFLWGFVDTTGKPIYLHFMIEHIDKGDISNRRAVLKYLKPHLKPVTTV